VASSRSSRMEYRAASSRALANYVRAVEYLLGLATGSIVLLVDRLPFHASGMLPWVFASPLIILGFCVVYGVLFMVLLIFNYEEFLHHDNYTRARYVRNQSLGFSALTVSASVICGSSAQSLLRWQK